MNKCKWSRDW